MPEPVLNIALAQAERYHVEATEAHQEAAAALQTIVGTIQTKHDQRAAITAARLAGTATPEDAAEYSALVGDIETLEGMRATAAQNLAQATQAVQAAANALNVQVASQQRMSDEADYLALHTATVRAEAAFVQALALTCRAGRKLGHVAMAQSYRFHQQLDRAMMNRVPPEVK
jgi:hypothetical protein